jgi:hypothetical protein
VIKTKRKPKKVVSTDLQKKLINGKYLGHQEPVLSEHPTLAERLQYFSWCSYMVKKDETRAWLETYLKSVGGEPITGIPDKWINPSLCYRARMLTKGVKFTAEQKSFFDQCLLDVYRHRGEKDEETEIEKIDRPTIQEHIAEKTSNILGDLEGMIDDGHPINIETFYRERNVNPRIAKSILTKFMPRFQELQDAAKWKDDDLKYAYRHLGKAGVVKELSIIENIISLTERFMTNTVKARLPRKKKTPSVDKKLKFLKDSFLPFSKEFNVNSIDPAKILGAQELWVLDTKYKIITVFRAESHGGQLDVHRTKIIGYDKNNSHSKRLGRKSIALVDQIVKASKAAAKKVIADLGETDLKERINENCILLRV